MDQAPGTPALNPWCKELRPSSNRTSENGGTKIGPLFPAGPSYDEKSLSKAIAGDGVTQFGHNAEWLMANADRPEEKSELRRFLARIRDGDEDAGRELLRLYEAKVRLVVRRQLPRLLRARFDSQDFVQSIWGSFFRRIKASPTELEGTENLIGFLARAGEQGNR